MKIMNAMPHYTKTGMEERSTNKEDFDSKH